MNVMKQYSVPLFTEGEVRVDTEITDGHPMMIESNSLVMEPLYEQDIDEVKQLNEESQKGYVTEYLKWNPEEDHSSPIEDFVAQSEEMWGSCYMYSVREKDTNELIGVAANNLESLLNRCDIGVWIAESNYESEYAPEVFSAIGSIAFEFMDMEVVKGKVDADNRRSIRSLQKSILGLGGSFEGLIRNHSTEKEIDGYRVRDVVVYSINKTEFYTLRDEPKKLDEMIESETDHDSKIVSMIV